MNLPAKIVRQVDVVVLEFGEISLVVRVGLLEDQQEGEGKKPLDQQHEVLHPLRPRLELVHCSFLHFLCCHRGFIIRGRDYFVLKANLASDGYKQIQSLNTN